MVRPRPTLQRGHGMPWVLDDHMLSVATISPPPHRQDVLVRRGEDADERRRCVSPCQHEHDLTPTVSGQSAALDKTIGCYLKTYDISAKSPLVPIK